MSIHYSKDLLQPQSDVVVPLSLPGRPRRRRGVLQRIAHAFAAWRAHFAETQALFNMNAEELRDIGITRADIPRVFGQAFAQEYARRGRFR